MKYRHKIALTLGLMIPLLSHAATQTINPGAPNVLEISVQDDTTPGVWVNQPNGRVSQYFPRSDWGWGTVIWLNGADVGSSYSSLYQQGGATAFSPETNTISGTGTSADPWTITTVVSLAATGVTFTQTITYVDGDRTIGKTFSITNSGELTYNDVRLFHGGDTTFGGDDSARSWWDNENSMIYVNNNNFINSGIMGFYANPATPASHHFGGSYGTGDTQAHTTARLDDTANSEYRDAGYYLEWDRTSLAPGETWTILSYETWSEPTFLQVIAPANDYVQADTTITRLFKVHNLNSAAKEISLSVASAPNGWTATLPNGSTINAEAFEVVSVPVQITVPAGTAPATIEDVTLEAEATEGETVVTGDSSTRLTVINLDVTITPNPVDFGVVAVGNSVDRTLTFTNNSGGDVTLGTVNTSSTGYSITTDNASGQTIATGDNRTIVLTFTPAANGVMNATISWPLSAPFVTNLTSSATGGEAVASPSPEPEPEITITPIYEEYTRLVYTNTLNKISIDLDPNSVLSGAFTTDFISGSLPSGLRIDGSTLTGVVPNVGIYNFKISQKSGYNEVRNIITIDCMTPTLTPTLYGCVMNGNYVQFTQLDGPTHSDWAETELCVGTVPANEPFELYFHWEYIKGDATFAIVGGELPPGLQMIDTKIGGVPNGYIYGTPTTPGEYTFVVSVKDWRGRSVQWFKIFVK